MTTMNLGATMIGTKSADTDDGSFTVYDALSEDNAIPLDNITDKIENEELEEISSKVIGGYEIDNTAFIRRKEKIEKYYKQAGQVIESKNYPFENASNIKYPLLTQAAISFAAIAYPSLIRGGEVAKYRVIGNDEGKDPIINPTTGEPLLNVETGKPIRPEAGAKARRGKRIAEHMNYQLLEENPDWEDDLDRILTIIPIVGCAFRKTYQDPVRDECVSKLVLPQFLVVDQNAVSFENAQRVSEEIILYPNEIQSNIRLGIFKDFDYGVSNSVRDGEISSNDDGQKTTEYDEDCPHAFIEQHCWLDLDEDGYSEPYIVWIHRDSSSVVRIMARYNIDSITENGGEIKRIIPDVYYTKYGFMPDPEGGFYDIGFGDLLYGLNSAVDTSINQLIDSGHRYVMGGGFIGRDLRMKGGSMKFKPGEFKSVNNAGTTIRDSVLPLPMPEPSVVLFQLMQFLIQAGEQIASLTKVMVGEIPANTQATTAMAALEQGMQPFKRIFKRVHRALKSELKKVYRLNSIYLDADKYNNILDEDVSIDDYNTKDFDIVPYSDSEMINNIQRFARAQFLNEYKDDPLIDQVEIRKEIFTIVGIENTDDLIKEPQPQGADPLVEAQVKLADAQIMRNNSDIALNEQETMAKIGNIKADTAKKASDSLLSLAKAESEEEGTQFDLHKQELDQLNEEFNGNDNNENNAVNNDGGRIRGMEEEPNNGEIPAVPQGF